MTDKIFRRIRGWLGHQPNEKEVPLHSARVEFRLIYGQLPLGVLSYQNSVWEWKYSDAFRAQERIVPLIEFPDVNRVYQTEELWPFFATRAPSLKRPDILQIIEREHIDKNDEVALLTRFGQRTITNPFELVAA